MTEFDARPEEVGQILLKVMHSNQRRLKRFKQHSARKLHIVYVYQWTCCARYMYLQRTNHCPKMQVSTVQITVIKYKFLQFSAHCLLGY